MKIIVGSTSKRKIKVTEEVIRKIFKNENISVVGYAANSQVPDTPYDKQTFDGAKNRAIDCKTFLDGDCFIGIESGLLERYGYTYEEAWSVVITSDGKEYYGYSSGLKVPEYILNKMKELKMEHSQVMTLIEEEFGKLPNDTWGTYSGGMILREISLQESLRNALIQMVAPGNSFYKK